MRPVGGFRVGADDPCLDGHFPGRPVVPGVVLLDEALAAVGRATGLAAPLTLARVKFASPVVPDEDCAVLLGDPRDDAQVAFAVRAAGDDRLVLSGSAEFRGKVRP